MQILPNERLSDRRERVQRKRCMGAGLRFDYRTNRLFRREAADFWILRTEIPRGSVKTYTPRRRDSAGLATTPVRQECAREMFIGIPEVLVSMGRTRFAPDLDLEGVSADEAFAVLGNEIRLEVSGSSGVRTLLTNTMMDPISPR
jgi:hypothetical protein